MTSLTMPASTVGGVCHDVRRMLSANLNDQLLFVASDYVPGSGVLALKSLTNRVAPGSLLSWHESTLYVVSVGQGNTLEVMPGYDGGPDVAIPAGTPMRLNPRFTDYTLFNAVAQAVGSMASPSNGLFALAKDYVSGLFDDSVYPIPDEYKARVVRVLSVCERTDDGQDWARISDYRVSLTPGNEHVRIFSEAQRFEIVYALEILKPSAFTDDLVEDCGLSGSMLDIPALGAAANLMSGQEARRNQQRAQGDPRRAEDVPITGAINVSRDLRRTFEQRINEEHARLVGMFPYRRLSV